MAWYDEEEQEDGAVLPGDISPALLEFIAKTQAGRKSEQETADAATVEQLKGLDESSRKHASAQMIAQGFDNATAGFLRRDPSRLQVPKVDENVKAFLAQKAQRKAPGPLDDLVKAAQAVKAMRVPPAKPAAEPPDDALMSAAQSYGIDPAPYRTRGELLTAVNAAMGAGRTAENQATAAARAEAARVAAEERAAARRAEEERRRIEDAGKKKVVGEVGDLDVAVEEADAVIAEVKKNPAAFYATAKIGEYLGDGIVGKVAGRVQSNSRDPKDTATRAVVLQRAYKLKNQLAGAAVSEGERKSIEEFNPSENDTAEQIIAKIEGMKRLAQIMRDAKAKRMGAAPPAAFPVPASTPAQSTRPGDKYLRR